MIESERKLLPRLKLMSYIFFVLSIASLLFILTFEEETLLNAELTEQEEEVELAPTEVLNFYFISFLFAAGGVGCLLLAKSRAKNLLEEPQETENSCPDKE